MKTTRPQFGTRENTASSRQHASRLAVNASSNSICIEEESPQTQRLGVHAAPSTTGFENALQATLQNSVTGGKSSGESHLLTVHEVAELLQVRVSWVYGRMRKRSAGRLPGFRLGKYWRFSEGEVLVWVESQRRGPHAA